MTTNGGTVPASDREGERPPANLKVTGEGEEVAGVSPSPPANPTTDGGEEESSTNARRTLAFSGEGEDGAPAGPKDSSNEGSN